MPIYPFKIVGVHYAVNPESSASAEETELMHQRTAERLHQLDEERPPVVLIPEPTNPADARAVMARVRGARIGYVDKTQLDIIHAIFASNGARPLMARIESVEARKHGWMNIAVETSEEVHVEPRNPCGEVWQAWTCTLPTLPVVESQFVLMEAEMMLDEALKRGTVDTAEYYLRLWLDNALHDLSNEARLAREHYIVKLKEMTPPNEDSSAKLEPRIKALVSDLEKQCTAICGQKRSNIRVDKWWKELLASNETEQLWKTWVARIDGNWEQGMTELDNALKPLPSDLYAFLDDRKLFFSRLHYSHVPREKYWQIVSLMLLRECMLRRCNQQLHHRDEEADEMPHLLKEAEEEAKFEVIVPNELQTPEARKILARLQKKGYLDEDLQPSALKGWQKGALAYELAGRFGIRHMWVDMARMWKCNPDTLRQYHSKEFAEPKTIAFVKNIKTIIY